VVPVLPDLPFSDVLVTVNDDGERQPGPWFPLCTRAQDSVYESSVWKARVYARKILHRRGGVQMRFGVRGASSHASSSTRCGIASLAPGPLTVFPERREETATVDPVGVGARCDHAWLPEEESIKYRSHIVTDGSRRGQEVR
jgi:hypothetical protein